jgi:hypothetical protein
MSKTRTYQLASYCRGDLEKDVRDVKDGQDSVVVVALEVEISFEARESSIACSMVSTFCFRDRSTRTHQYLPDR